MPEPASGFSRRGYVLLALLALGWGLNWPIMKIVLRDVPPLTFRGACLLIGGVGVLALARLGGVSLRVARRDWRPLAWLTACNIAGWNVFAIYGIDLLPSGRAALLGYTMPLWSILLSAWLLHERLTPRRLAGLGLGMAGVAVLMSADIRAAGGALVGVACMLAAAASWGLGVVLLKRAALRVPTIVLTGWMMTCGGLPLAAAALALEYAAWRPVGPYPAVGVLYNIVIAFMFCYWAWNRIVLMVPVAVSSLSALITPVIGVLSGMVLLGEQPQWREWLAATLILGAIALVIRGERDVAPTPAPGGTPAV
jgi:drug/metabolite transporter (DMT)-like permease